MSDPIVPKVILTQLEDALEERQTKERRKEEAEKITQERRKENRRSAKK